MIVSMAIAVLPVCRSPLFSWRWPRPIGVIASIALMPVCSGSFTGWRCTTLGACNSSARSVVSSTGPLPSSGCPSGPTMRPRNASPTGTDSTSPVRLTRWPSSILLKSPSMTTPISRTSRFSASPLVPSSNSSSSFAIADGRPSTLAMPSPHSTTVPTSSVAAAPGSYASTKRASASLISSGRIVSSVIFLASFSSGSYTSAVRGLLATGWSGGQVTAQLGEPAGDASVNELVADPHRDTADQPRVEHHIQVHVMSIGRDEGRGQPGPLFVGERHRDVDFRDEPLAQLGGEVHIGLKPCIQATSSRVRSCLGDQPKCRGADLARHQLGHQCGARVGWHELVGQRRTQARIGLHDPAEPEELVLKFVKLSVAVGGVRDRKHGKFVGRVGDVNGLGPPRRDHRRHHFQG